MTYNLSSFRAVALVIFNHMLRLNPLKLEFMWSTFPTSHPSHRQISVRPSGWPSQRLNMGAKWNIFWRMHVYGWTCQPSGVLVLLPTAPHQIYPSLFINCGGDESRELVLIAKVDYCKQHSRRTNKAPNWLNTVNPEHCSARYLWPSTFWPHHADFERPTPLAESTAKIWIQAVPARVQANSMVGTSLHHQVLHWSSIKTVPPFIHAPVIPRSPSFQDGDAWRTFILDRRVGLMKQSSRYC